VELKGVTDDLEIAYNDSNHGTLSTAILRAAEDEWNVIMTALGNYVDSIAKGSQTIINGAGMPASSASHVPVPLTMVIGVEGTSGKLTGEIIWKWKSVKRSRIYLGYLKEADAPDSEYKLVVFSTKTKVFVSGLNPGVKYLLQVRAAGASGLSPLSDASGAYAAF
jgi:hypothetical protein